MDFDNMTKDELLEILKESYIKMINPMPRNPDFKVGNYYRVEQTGSNEIEIYGEDNTLYLTYKETNKYFKY